MCGHNSGEEVGSFHEITWTMSDDTAPVVSPGTETHTVTLAYKKTSLKKIQIVEVSRTSDINRGDVWPYTATGSAWPCLIRAGWTKVTPRGPFQPHPLCDPLIPSRTQPHCPKHWETNKHR